MVFSSTIFLFAFLPIVLLGHLLLRSVRSRNALLLVASLFFYTWGESGYTAILLLSIGINWSFGLWLHAARNRPTRHRILTAAIALDLLLLASFKYANFIVDSLAGPLGWLGLPPFELAPVHLPIGISFFTFQALTYVVDVHRGEAPAQRSPLTVALYIALFPQLIAGPIVRYGQIAKQLSKRFPKRKDVAEGTRRFAIGLGKKILVANTLAGPADRIFSLPVSELPIGVAWLGVLCYALQIYFDFAGYSDMAIGLGRCLGFHFPENFDWPYLSLSLREFWRRWHISLSSWFRDYLYIPLGGSRRSPLRTGINLLSVFALCGLWHGASWNFVVWGLVHGAFLSLERTFVGRGLALLPPVLRRIYTLSVVLLAWVFFRADDLGQALSYLSTLFRMDAGDPRLHPLALYLDPEVAATLAISLLCTMPSYRHGIHRFARRLTRSSPLLESIRIASLAAVLLLCAMKLAAGTHNPFIYFRF